MCMSSAHGDQKRLFRSLVLELRGLGAAMWVCRDKPVSLGRAAIGLNHIPPKPHLQPQLQSFNFVQ